MTDLTDATRADVAIRPDRMRVVRLIAGYGAIAFMLPYLALKIAWLGGNPIGFNDESLVGKPGMIAANAISFGMDFVAVGLALTFTHRGMALYNCLSFVKFTAGMLIGLVTVVLLAERQAAISPPAP